jgi:alpha-glucosidase
MRIFVLLLILTIVLTTSKYRVTSVTQNTTSFTIALAYTGNDTYYLKPTSPILKSLLFTVRCHTTTDLTFKITDSNRTRFEVPQTGIFPIDPVANFSFPLTNSLFQFSYTQDPFDFTIIRKFDNEVLFDTSKGELIFSDYYMEITTTVTSRIVYGFSERFSDSFRIKPGQFTIFNRDRGQTIDNGTGLQTYGYYPVYLVRENSGNFHMNYLRSSNAMDIVVKNYSVAQYTFTYKVIGGVLDFRFFLG